MTNTKIRGRHEETQVRFDECVSTIYIPADHYRILNSVEEGEKWLRWLDDIETDDKIKVILFMNEPGAYSEENYQRYHAGLMNNKARGIGKAEGGTANRMKRTREMHLLQRIILKLMRSGKLYIDCLRGEVISPFIGASLAADMRFAAEDVRLVFSHLRKGPYIDGGLPFFLQRYVGHAKALQIMLGRGEMSAEEAQSLGLIDRILPAGDFEQACIDGARRLCTYDAEDLRIMKRLFYHFSDELERIFHLEATLVE
jgi:enoyl-CoA hydratase/carnithine racemase